MLAQYIFNKAISTKPDTLLHKIFLTFRNALKSNNNLVKFNYHNYKLKLPLSHDYPFNLQRNPEYSQNLGVVASIVKKEYSDLKAIDIGANIGDSALIINHFIEVPVLCVEGNPKFLPLLKENTKQLKDISICENFVGESDTEKVVAVNYLGTSRLEVSSEGSSIKTMDSILEEFAEFNNAKLLKIDTDGFDNKIIRASANYIENAKPVIFFEYDPRLLDIQNEKGFDIFDFLNNLGYKKVVLFDNLGRLLCECETLNSQLLNDLTQYYRKDKFGYLDVCAIHNDDKELITKIRQAFI